MTDTATDRSTAAPPGRARATLGRLALIGAALLAVNLVVYAIGRAVGGDFTYTQDGAAVLVEPVAITLLSLGPLTTGIALIAALARKWPVAIRVAYVVAPVFSVATIGVMTLPADFDTASTVCLTLMHLATIPAALLALRTLQRRASPA